MSTKRGMALPTWIALCLLFLVSYSPHVTSARPTADAPNGCWRVVPSSATNGEEIGASRLYTAPANELWAIGYRSPTLPTVLRWNNGAWNALPALPITGTYNLSPSIKVFSASDVWALVNTFVNTANGSRNVITTVHWDGKDWHAIPFPLLVTEDYLFNDLDGTSSSDLWTVGTERTGSHHADLIGLVFHFDGNEWKQVDSPLMHDNQTGLNRVSVLSTQNVWAIGTKVLQWDGRQWKNIRGVGSVPGYEDIVALATDNIWAISSLGPSSTVGHWDGHTWTETHIPSTGNVPRVSSIAAAAPNDIWAVGHSDEDAFFMHWDGSAWIPIPNPVPGFSSGLISIVASGDEIWATGYRIINASGQSSGVLMRYTSTPCPSSAPQKPLNPPVPLPGTGSQQFITGESASGIFLKYWQEHGGLAQQGYPISGVLGEQSDLDGRIYTIQYFERAAFEYHPENKGTPYEVLLAQLGTFQYKEKYPNGAPNQRANQDRGTLFFPETGKHLGGTFLRYWQEHGGLQQQGYPISEEFTEVSDLNGKPYTVQYFERAVFEWHPENTPPYNVLLSQLGHFRYFNKYTLQQSQMTPPRRIADAITPNTLHGAGNYLVWLDQRTGVNSGKTIYAYNASQNREQPISDPLPGGMPLAANGTLAFWTRPDIDRRYLEGFNLKTGTAARIDQPSTVSSPDFRRSDNIALDATTLYYVDNWTGHTGIFAYDLGANTERRIYDKVPVPGSLVAADGALLWTEEASSGTNKERTLRLYRASNGTIITLVSGIGGFTGYGVSGSNVVYSFYGTIANQTTYLYNMDTGARKVVAFGAASNPVIQGKRVAWVRWPSVESGEADGWKIETYNIDTGAVQTVASSLRAMPRNLVLLEGDKLAFAADNDLTLPGSELYILEMAPLP